MLGRIFTLYSFYDEVDQKELGYDASGEALCGLHTDGKGEVARRGFDPRV